jgi:hypothetical protein
MKLAMANHAKWMISGARHAAPLLGYSDQRRPADDAAKVRSLWRFLALVYLEDPPTREDVQSVTCLDAVMMSVIDLLNTGCA